MTRLKPRSLTRRLQSRFSQNALISALKSRKTRNSSHDSPSHPQHLVKSGQHDFSAEIGPGLRRLSRYERAAGTSKGKMLQLQCIELAVTAVTGNGRQSALSPLHWQVFQR